MEPAKYFNSWKLRATVLRHSSTSRYGRHLLEFQKSPYVHWTHISVSMNVILDPFVCTFNFWSPLSFVSCIIHPHRTFKDRKQGKLLHPLILQFLQPFFVKSVGCLVASRLGYGLVWRSRRPSVQSTLCLGKLFAQFCTLAACPLTTSNSAGKKNQPKEWLQSYRKELVYSSILSQWDW